MRKVDWRFVVTDNKEQLMQINLFVDGFNTEAVIELNDEEDYIDILCYEIEELINKVDSQVKIEIVNDEERLGLIVDIWDMNYEEILDSSTFWFEDYENNVLD